MDSHTRLFVARMMRRHPHTLIVPLDQVGDISDDGRFVAIPCYMDGVLTMIVLFKRDDLAEAVETVITQLHPASATERLH